ncbi:glycosyltransferase [Algoriphagus sp. D3-2-R+10]|uniref:glycosyltransferase n=1 Tax=Algoriphagus aurantiacus TaxID=3103948 RepID=UPI002B3BF6A9|nr:glycosyltransferase [Algoriphagus sp. D3-2-R+10]MEB2778315.1 glycosyltransferase [Algoriphagus sp. D3-2-R+10]
MSNEGISIIVCTFNGKNRLPQTLAAINQLYEGIDRELILVDNASTDGTSEWVRNYLTELCPDLSWKIIYEPVPGLSHARIAGISASSFEYVLFCDDDNQLFKDYLDLGYRILKANPEIGVLGGFGIPVFEIDKPEWFDRYSQSYAVGPQSEKSGIIEKAVGYVYGAGTFFRKEPMLEILQSGYQLALTGRKKEKLISGDDLEWSWLMRLKGYDIAYEKSLQFYHLLSKERLNENYYIKLKSGTASGSGILFGYTSYLKNPKMNSIQYTLAYANELFKSFLVFTKHAFLRPFVKKSWEKELGFRILESRKNSFLENGKRSIRLYKELMRFFPGYSRFN